MTTTASTAASAPERATLEERLLAFIHTELLAPGETITRDDDLLSDLLDSVAVLRLATYVDEEFGLTTKPQDFVVENFQSVAVLAGYVERARAASA
ncbi:MAG: phosphopantetheine-binding protein [Acidobacteriota bacterium]